MMTVVPSRLQALLFTDIVDSAGIKLRAGTLSYTADLKRHNALFEAALAADSGGTIVKHTGDGFFATFATPSQAVRAAVQFQRGLAAQQWATEPLRVRIGIHMGEIAVVRMADRTDIVGSPADTAARVMALAGPGQILLSALAAEEARRFLGDQAIRWTRHGAFRLKGDESPVEIWEVADAAAPVLPTPLQAPMAPAAPPLHANVHANADLLPFDASPTALPSPLSSSSSAVADVSAGMQFGKYRLIAELGRGAMGVVYTAHQPELDRVVCLKMIVAGPYASREQVERLFREAQSAARLSHPNIVPVYEFGEIHGRYSFTMEYVRGRSLAGVIDRKPLPPAVAAVIALRAARALQYAHEQGVVHRDIKPSNILIHTPVAGGSPSAEEWERAEIKVADFGLARQLNRGGNDERLTLASSVLGTPLYMSPEQARGENDRVDAKSDVFSLGVVLYEMLTGTPPLADLPVRQVLRRLEDDSDQPPAPAAVSALVDPDLEGICLQATRKNRSERYPNAGAMADDLEAYLQGRQIKAPRASAWPWRRWRRPVIAAASLLIALIAGTMVFKYGAHRAARLVPSDTDVIPYTQAQRYLGSIRTVEGEIADVSRTAHRVFLNFGSEAELVVLCNQEDWGRFPEGFEKLYEGRRVRVCGQIQAFQGTFEIVLSDPAQIRILPDEMPGDSRVAEAAAEIIPWNDAINYLGKMKTVEGRVSRTARTTANVFINFASERNSFAVVCRRSAWPRFPEGFEKLYEGRVIRVCGTIESYQGKPQMLLRNPSQIRIAREPRTGSGSGVAADGRKSPAEVIPWEKAAQYTEAVKTVEGIILRSSRSAHHVFLNFSSERTALAVVCHEGDWPKFGPGFEKFYEGKAVRVTGRIATYDGRPQIVLENPSQIELAREAGSSAALAIATKPASPELIPWASASQHVGDVKTVEGIVLRTARAPRAVFLNFADDRTTFCVICRDSNWPKFAAGFEKFYEGKRIRITGRIMTFEGRPEIVLESPSQIEVAREGQASLPLTTTTKPVSAEVIPWSDAPDFVGTVRTVQGRVIRTYRTTSNVFLNFSPDLNAFSIVCHRESWQRFPAKFETRYVGKKVRVSGTIEVYKGHPQMVLEDPSQIQVDDSPAPTTAAASPAEPPER